MIGPAQGFAVCADAADARAGIEQALGSQGEDPPDADVSAAPTLLQILRTDFAESGKVPLLSTS